MGDNGNDVVAATTTPTSIENYDEINSYLDNILEDCNTSGLPPVVVGSRATAGAGEGGGFGGDNVDGCAGLAVKDRDATEDGSSSDVNDGITGRGVNNEIAAVKAPSSVVIKEDITGILLLVSVE